MFKANKIVFIHVYGRVYLYKAMTIQTQKSKIMIAIDRFETLYIVRSYSAYTFLKIQSKLSKVFV